MSQQDCDIPSSNSALGSEQCRVSSPTILDEIISLGEAHGDSGIRIDPTATRVDPLEKFEREFQTEIHHADWMGAGRSKSLENLELELQNSWHSHNAPSSSVFDLCGRSRSLTDLLAAVGSSGCSFLDPAPDTLGLHSDGLLIESEPKAIASSPVRNEPFSESDPSKSSQLFGSRTDLVNCLGLDPGLAWLANEKFFESTSVADKLGRNGMLQKKKSLDPLNLEGWIDHISFSNDINFDTLVRESNEERDVLTSLDWRAIDKSSALLSSKLDSTAKAELDLAATKPSNGQAVSSLSMMNIDSSRKSLNLSKSGKKILVVMQHRNGLFPLKKNGAVSNDVVVVPIPKVKSEPIPTSPESVEYDVIDPDGIIAKLEEQSECLQVEGKRMYRCAECSKMLRGRASLRSHLMAHQGKKPFKCPYPGCDWSFVEKFLLVRHEKFHRKEGRLKCDDCDATFSTLFNLQQHQKKFHMTSPTVPCPLCSQCFHSNRLVREHVDRCHGNFKIYKCESDGCDKSFRTLSSLHKHQRIHERDESDCVCQFCHKKFRALSLKVAHERTHTGERPYSCPYEGCNWSFATKSKLTHHVKTHENRREFKCCVHGCEKTFLRKEHLRSHELSHTKVNRKSIAMNGNSVLSRHCQDGGQDDADGVQMRDDETALSEFDAQQSAMGEDELQLSVGSVEAPASLAQPTNDPAALANFISAHLKADGAAPVLDVSKLLHLQFDLVDQVDEDAAGDANDGGLVDKAFLEVNGAGRSRETVITISKDSVASPASVVLENLSGSARTDYKSNHRVVDRIRRKRTPTPDDDGEEWIKRSDGLRGMHYGSLPDTESAKEDLRGMLEKMFFAAVSSKPILSQLLSLSDQQQPSSATACCVVKGVSYGGPLSAQVARTESTINLEDLQ